MSEFKKVANKTDIPEEIPKAFDVAGTKIVLCQAFGKFYALEDRCTHAAVALSTGPLIGKELHCPLHGARFDVTSGRALCPPARRDVPTFPVEVRGEEIWVCVTSPADTQ